MTPPLETLILSGGTLIGSGAPETIERRNPILWPFSANSLWNTSVGDQIEYGGLDHPMAVELRSEVGQLNYATYSTPINRGKVTDPPITIREVAAGDWSPGLRDTVLPHAPDPVVLAGEWGLSGPVYNGNGDISFTGAVTKPDLFMSIIDEESLEAIESYKTFWTQGGASTRILVARDGTVHRFSLLGDGWTQRGARASRLSFTGGLIRSWEMNAAAVNPFTAIRHALAMAIKNEQFLRPNTDTGYPTPGYQWPARSYDSDGNSVYTGNIRMGTQFILDPNYVIESAGLTNEGLALAYALRYYGAYVTDRSQYVSLYAEQAVSSTAAFRMKEDWQDILLANMVPVLNNSALNPGGPGVRTRLPAPPFAL